MKSHERNSEITVLLIEDHDKVRAAVRAILESAEDIHVVAEAAEGAQAIALAEQEHPDVLLVDSDVAVMSGEMAVGPVLEKLPAARLLIMTSYDDVEYAQGLVEEGAAGCLLKDDVPGWLVEAVHSVLEERDKAWISPGLQARSSSADEEVDSASGDDALA